MSNKVVRMNRVTEHSVQDVYEEFQSNNEIKGLSKATIKSYEQHLNIFLKYLQTEGIHSIDELSKQVVNGYIKWLQDNHSNIVTIATYMRAVRCFLHYAMGEGYVSEFMIFVPKQEKRLKRFIARMILISY